MGCVLLAHDGFDKYNMDVLAAPTCNYYENYKYSYDIDEFIEKVSLSEKRLIFCRSLWKKKLMKL